MNALRETPTWKVHDRWAIIKHKREEMFEHFVLNEHESGHKKRIQTQGILRLVEICGIWVCRNFHKTPHYVPGDLHSTCACGKKYAVPWLFNSHPTIKPLFSEPQVYLEPDVYVNDSPFPVPSEPTRQSPIRYGTQGVM